MKRWAGRQTWPLQWLPSRWVACCLGCYEAPGQSRGGHVTHTWQVAAIKAGRVLMGALLP